MGKNEEMNLEPTFDFEKYQDPLKDMDEEAYRQEKFTDEERQKIEEVASKINLYDTNVVISYGADAQRRLADFSDFALKCVRTKETNEIGDLLSGLVADLKYDPEGGKGGLLGLFRKGASKIANIKAHYTKVGMELSRKVQSLNSQN